jgi:glycerate 2-kinase
VAGDGVLRDAGHRVTPTVLVAPDKFKGSLTATEVAAAVSEGLAASGVSSVQLPLADGGDGSVDAAIAAGFVARHVTVADASGAPRSTMIAESDDTVLVEVANTCGLSTLPDGRLLPLDASSLGFGQAVRRALDARPARIVLALGGSASTDGGTGLLGALGYVFRDASGRAVRPCGRDLARIAAVDASDAVSLRDVDLHIASDVTNPLLGGTGAAAVFGPQKGADAVTIRGLDDGLSHLVDVLVGQGFADAASVAAAPGAGAAGGLGFAAMLLGAQMSSGADYFLDLLGFEAAAEDCGLVVTGEGRIDDQTRDGKLVSAVVSRSGGRPVVVVAGASTLTDVDRVDAGIEAIYAVSDHADSDTSQDPELTRRILVTIGARIGSQVISDLG